MTIAAVHAHPWLTAPAALVVAAGLVWYWLQLGRPEVPAPRRRVRRVSLFMMLLALPSLVRGLSFVDPQLDHAEYLITWSVALLLVLLVFMTAFIDAMVTLRLQHRDVEAALEDAGRELAAAMRDRRGEDAAAGGRDLETPPGDGGGGDARA